MNRPSIERITLVGAALGGAVLTAGAVVAQRAHLRTVAADPLNERLSVPPPGRPITAVSPDGTTLHVELFGDEGASGPTFVLAHGWTEQLSYWTLVIERLTARGFRVAAYDLRGHGHSAPAVAGDYALARFGEDLEAVLATVCPDREPAIPVGHSLGAMSIVAWAEHHDVRARACAAALLNTGVGSLIAESTLVPLPWLAAALNRTPLATGLLTTPGGVPKFSTPLSAAMVRYIAFGPTATPAQVAFYERMLVACPPDVRATVGLALTEMDLHHAVPQLCVPTLVLAGANDRLTPPVHAEKIAAALPQPEGLIVLPATGHMGPLERPDEIARALSALADGTLSALADGALAPPSAASQPA